jgi:hypothetical protein
MHLQFVCPNGNLGRERERLDAWNAHISPLPGKVERATAAACRLKILARRERMERYYRAGLTQGARYTSR